MVRPFYFTKKVLLLVDIQKVLTINGYPYIMTISNKWISNKGGHYGWKTQERGQQR